MISSENWKAFGNVNTHKIRSSMPECERHESKDTECVLCRAVPQWLSHIQWPHNSFNIHLSLPPKMRINIYERDINSYLSPRMNLFVLKINRFNSSHNTEHLFGTVFAICYCATTAALLLFWTFVSEPRTATWLDKRFVLFSLFPSFFTIKAKCTKWCCCFNCLCNKIPVFMTV